MARHLLRLQYPGAIYHVTIRSNARQNIFGDDRDHERFLKRLADSVETYRVRLYLFCLMTNHVAKLLAGIEEYLGQKLLESAGIGRT